MTATTFDRTIPHDDIGFEILNNVLFFRRDAVRAADEKFDLEDYSNILLDRIAQDKPFSRRMIEKFQSQINLKILRDRKIMVICQFKLSANGSMARRRVTSVRSVEVRWRHTPKGMLYFCYPEKSKVWFLYSAHFFNRFIERGVPEDDLTRVTAVGKFIWHVMTRDTNKIIIDSNREVLFFCAEGAALGYMRTITNRERDNRVPVIFFKTFVGRDMLSPHQLRLEAEQGRDVAPLNFESFAEESA